MKRRTCAMCGGPHGVERCDQIDEPVRVPLAVPSHNGPYAGPAPVRVLPPGLSGDATVTEWARANAARSQAKQKALAAQVMCCGRGHRLEGDNLYVYPDGKRRCRTCQKLHTRRQTKKRLVK